MALRILAVDDDPQILGVLKSLVEPMSCEVVCLSDSGEAARRIERERFDGIALDAVMPHPDGFELTARIRGSRSNSSTPIILITGHDPVEMMRRGFQAGITFFLSKPLTLEKVRGLLRAARGSILKERRRHVRLPLLMEVSCRCGGKQWNARSVDVAQGGILLEGVNEMPGGQIVELHFVLPGTTRQIKLLGKTTRQEALNRVAVEFIDPEPQDREALDHYITAGTQE